MASRQCCFKNPWQSFSCSPFLCHPKSPSDRQGHRFQNPRRLRFIATDLGHLPLCSREQPQILLIDTARWPQRL